MNTAHTIGRTILAATLVSMVLWVAVALVFCLSGATAFPVWVNAWIMATAIVLLVGAVAYVAPLFRKAR